MDEKFLEFWGNLLITLAQGKKQANDISEWMKKGFENVNPSSSQTKFSSFEDLLSMYQKFYGLDKLSERSVEYERMAQKASQDFQNSLHEYLSMMGMVSKSEHLSLVKKYEDLKKKCADQEETIKHLQMLLESKESDQGKNVGSLNDIVKTQTDLFQKMMTGFTQGFSSEKSESTTKELSSTVLEEQIKQETPLKGNIKNDKESRRNVKTIK